MFKRRAILATGATLLLVGSSAFVTSHAQASSQEAATTPATVDEDAQAVTFQELQFAHPVSLESAVTVVEGAGSPIAGYHFESDSIIGDFWPGSGLSVEAFLAECVSKSPACH